MHENAMYNVFNVVKINGRRSNEIMYNKVGSFRPLFLGAIDLYESK